MLLEALTVDRDAEGTPMLEYGRCFRLAVIWITFVGYVLIIPFFIVIVGLMVLLDHVFPSGQEDPYECVEYRAANCYDNINHIWMLANEAAKKQDGRFPDTMKEISTGTEFQDFLICSRNPEDRQPYFLVKGLNQKKHSGMMPYLIERPGNHRSRAKYVTLDWEMDTITYQGNDFLGLLSYFKEITEAERSLLKQQFEEWDKQMALQKEQADKSQEGKKSSFRKRENFPSDFE